VAPRWRCCQNGIEPTETFASFQGAPEEFGRGYFAGRRSAIMPGSPRNASDPLNAMLNSYAKVLRTIRDPVRWSDAIARIGQCANG